MKLTLDPVPLLHEKPHHFDCILKNVDRLIATQNKDGYWGDEDLTDFQKIYYTTQVVQCLIRSGFLMASDVVQKALSYLDNFREISIENRAKFFLYLPLGKMSEHELNEYLELLKKIQRENGSFFYEIRDLKGKVPEENGWTGVRRGSFIFYTLHVLHFLSMISPERYGSLMPLKDDIQNRALKFLLEELEKKGKIPYTLQDPTTGHDDPELTSYAVALLSKLGHRISNFSEIVEWILNKQVGGSWLNRPKETSLIIIDLASLSFDSILHPKVEGAITEAMRWLVSQSENWEKNPNLTALVVSALIFGNNFLDPHFYNSFFMNYTEEMHRKIKTKDQQLRKTEKMITVRNLIWFILGIAIPIIIERIILPILHF